MQLRCCLQARKKQVTSKEEAMSNKGRGGLQASNVQASGVKMTMKAGVFEIFATPP
ncbi:MAG: hypothetical protein JNM19_04600 [Chitinophagaceae bacterium]|nr:hypothetical protein [Chitinophagaceae bacterium]